MHACVDEYVCLHACGNEYVCHTCVVEINEADCADVCISDMCFLYIFACKLNIRTHFMKCACLQGAISGRHPDPRTHMCV
jgi:hypothetical protein